MKTTTEKTAKATLLHHWHMAHGAKMSDFGGYDMPLWYASPKNEHLCVLTHAGLFDTSHMAVVMVTGPHAFDLLQGCITANMSACIGKLKKPLGPGRCVYGAFLTEDGHVVDDAIVFQIAAQHYMVVVNAGMGGAIAALLRGQTRGRDVCISDLTDKVGKLDIQGPVAAKVMTKILVDPDRVFDTMPYFSFKGYFESSSALADAVRLTDGTPILLSRTGYTGEFGFEIFVAPEHFLRVWEMVLSAGKAFDVMACGLAARDSLRCGAVLPLSHQDIGPWPYVRHPWPFALPHTPDGKGFTKSFTGDNALLRAVDAAYTYPFVGDDLRKVTLPAVVLDGGGVQIGTVLTCTTDMGIGRHGGRIYSVTSPDRPADWKIRGLSCGFVKVGPALSPGQPVTLKDGRREIGVRIAADIRPCRTARLALKDMR